MEQGNGSVIVKHNGEVKNKLSIKEVSLVVNLMLLLPE